MPFRFLDLDRPVSESPDFTIRSERPTLKELFVVFVTMILTGLCVENAVYDRLALASILFVVIGLAAVYATTQIHVHRQKQRATEFQNRAARFGAGHRQPLCPNCPRGRHDRLPQSRL